MTGTFEHDANADAWREIDEKSPKLRTFVHNPTKYAWSLWHREVQQILAIRPGELEAIDDHAVLGTTEGWSLETPCRAGAASHGRKHGRRRSATQPVNT